MKKLLLAFAAGVCLSACATHDPKISIVPYPNHLEPGHGTFAVKGEGVVCDSRADERTQRAVAEFAAQLAKTSGGENPVTVADELPASGIRFVLDQTLPEEGYRLDVTPKGVEVRASRFPGFFYAVQSLRQMLPAAVYGTEPAPGKEWVLPCVSIEDAPRFAYRGMHLDVARHFFSVEEVKRYLDVMAIHKLNRFHWHLTDDQGWRIEIKKYPELTTVGSIRKKTMIRKEWDNYDNTPYGGYYTQDEIRDIVAYAADRAITVIPEIDLPGHMLSALTAYPELGCTGGPYEVWGRWGVADDVLCPGQEKTFEFLEDVLDEVVGLFPSELIHIGGDECPKVRWEKCPRCQARIRQLGLRDKDGYTAEHYLQGYVTDRIGKYLAERGRRIIGWDEILEGQAPSDAIVMSWRGSAGGIKAAKLGHDVIMTPGSEGMYIDQFQGDYKINPVSIGGFTTAERVYKYNPVPDTLAAAGKGHFIKGVQCNVWSEYLYNTDIMEYRIYPRILALSEIAWSPLDRKDYKDFERRLDNAQVRLDGHDINYYIPQPEQPNGSCNFVAFTDKATMTFTTNRPMKMVYTLDGTEPTPESTVYTAPFDITETTTVKIASVLPSGKMGKPRTILVEKQTLAPAKEVAKTTPGLDMEVFDGMYLSVNNLEAAQKTGKKQVIKTTRELTNQVPAPESMRGVKQYAAIATGYVNIPEDGVYYISSDLEEVWIDGKLMVNNGGEVKRFSRHDTSAALAKGLHEIKLVFLGHIIGGWPSNWNDGSVQLRKSDAEKFTPITAEMLSH